MNLEKSGSSHRIRRFLSPRNIAVIGGGWGEEVVRQCLKMPYSGGLHVVHPKRAEICGVPCVSAIADLPALPDAAFVAVNRYAAIDAVRELAAAGCGGAVVVASGFAETGNAALQAALVDAAGNMPIQGPNCFGYPLRHAQEGKLMERTEILDLMGTLKLYGMRLTYGRLGIEITGLKDWVFPAPNWSTQLTPGTTSTHRCP